MRNPNRWTYSILFLAAAWAGTAGLSQAAALTPTSGDSSNPASSNQAPSNNSSNAPSFPKQSDVQPFNPNTAAEISSSDKAAAVGNVQTQGSVKAGTLQNAPGLGRDIATGQASGKRQYAPVKTGKVANTTAIPGGGDPVPAKPVWRVGGRTSDVSEALRRAEQDVFLRRL